MEQNSSEHNLPPPPMRCRSGCGFFGSPSFEGMCSKCFKDTLKRRQQSTSPTALLSQSAISAAVSETATSIKAISNDTAPEMPSSARNSPTPGATATSTSTSTTPSVETASTTIPSATASSQDKEDADSSDKAQADIEGATAKEPVSEESSPTNEVKKSKKNKCHTCKKKVGLTGFQCRCGGLYCSMHRYSDKHDCQFDYRELAQQQIRKQNPVVVGQKVQKI